MRRLLLATSLAAFISPAAAIDLPSIGSPSEIWAQRNFKDKVTYLEGICDGLSTSNHDALGELFCSSPTSNSAKTRFCLLVHSADGKEAVAYVDRFYQNRQRREIPIWAVIGAHNDGVCSEDVVTSRLPKMQKIMQCRRQTMNLITTPGISPDTVKTQQAHCKSLEQ